MSRTVRDDILYEPGGLSPEDQDVETPAYLVSLHFLVNALRRRRTLVVVGAVLGTALAALFLVLSPPSHTARTAMLLAGDPKQDPSRTSSTDMSLLDSRTVAESTIKALRLDVTPEQFLQSVEVAPDSASLVVLTLTADTEAEAKRRLTAFTAEYLAFRGTQVTAQSDALAAGIRQRIESLQKQVQSLDGRIRGLRVETAASTTQLNELVGERAQVVGQINSLEQQVSELQIGNQAIISGSRVVDPAAAQPSGTLVRSALILGSGLFLGLVLAASFVLVSAVVSTSLRRRDEVTLATQAPVLLSVGALGILPGWLGSIPFVSRLVERRQRDLARFVNVLQVSLPSSWRGQRLTVACIDNGAEVARGVVAAAVDLQRQGRNVHLLDLTGGAHLAAALRRCGEGGEPLSLWLPQTVPSFAQDPADLFPVGANSENRRYSLRQTDIALVMVDLDPAVPPDHISAFSDRVVLTVTSGRSSAERLRGASEMLTRAGVAVRGVILLRNSDTDESVGLLPSVH